MTDTQAADLIERIRARSHPMEPMTTGVEVRIEPLPYIRALLFDIEGTLLISGAGGIEPTSGRDANSAIRAALDASGYAKIPLPEGFDVAARLKQAIDADQAGSRKKGMAYPDMDTRAIWRKLLAELLAIPSKKLDQATLERVAVEYQCRVDPVWPMPGLAETLATLKARGLKLGIVANAQFHTPLRLEALLGKSCVDAGFDPACCILSYRLLEAKPSPRLFEEALIALENEHAILADEVLHVGSDMRNDVQSAAATGFKTALFAGDMRSLRYRETTAEVAGAAPDRVLTDLRQLPDLLPQIKHKGLIDGLDLDADIDD